MLFRSLLHSENYKDPNIKIVKAKPSIFIEEGKIQCKFCIVVSEKIFENVGCCEWMTNDFGKSVGKCMKCYAKKGFNMNCCEKCKKEFSPLLQEKLKELSSSLHVVKKASNPPEPKEINLVKNGVKEEAKSYVQPKKKEYQIQDSSKLKDQENTLEDKKEDIKIQYEVQSKIPKCINCNRAEIPNDLLIPDIGCINKHSFHVDCLLKLNPNIKNIDTKLNESKIFCPHCHYQTNFQIIKEAITKKK